MAGAGITITIDDAPVRQALAGLLAAGSDLAPLLDAIGGAIEFSVQRRFDTEAGPGGSPWPKSLRALVAGGQTLTDTGRLRQSITHNVVGNAVEVGTNVIYAAIHQFGGVIRPKTAKALVFLPYGAKEPVMVQQVVMPARPFLGIDDDVTEIPAIVTDWVARAAGPEMVA